MNCPLCGGGRSAVILADQPFRRCIFCDTVFNTAHMIIAYSDSYYTKDYHAQYGRTYEEDFDSIYHSSVRRIERIRTLWNSFHKESPRSVLDIGCALGFFLKAAEDHGFTRVDGIEVSQFASRRCRELFGFAVTKSPFEKADIGCRYDLITSWYFLEHCVDTKSVLEKIIAHLENGGIFAFSVPSVFGPTYLFNKKKWAETHPVDHMIDLSPKTAVRILKRAGFKKVKVYAAGIHPERIMSKKNPIFLLFKPLYTLFSRATAFSDTIEIYAIK
jgi:SAM-dependent methyltransferase